jgi:mannose-6-phosphate isomerase-like protein (cupin superfamily)
MKRLRLVECAGTGDGPVFAGLLPGLLVERGGLSQYVAEERTHPEGRHVHDVPEVFWILQGSGQVEIDGLLSPFQAGDVLYIDPGEDHHLISQGDVPLVSVWTKLRQA